MKHTLIFAALLASGLVATTTAAAAGTGHAERTIATAATLQAALQDGRYWDDRPDRQFDTLAELEMEIAGLRNDWRVRRFARDELERAAAFVVDLGEEPPGTLDARDFDRAERLIDRARDVARQRHAERRHGRDRDVVVVEQPPRRHVDREVVVVEQPPRREIEREVVVVEDERARREAAEARDEAARAREQAEAERERALAAQLERDHERGKYEELREELSELQTKETERGLVVTLGDVLFEVGRADLKANAVRTLDQLAKAMRDNPDSRVIVEGHTDSTGTRSFNYTLSERRANAVRSFLIKNGVATTRIESRGLGPDTPVASNSTASGRAQNRRVEVIVQNEE